MRKSKKIGKNKTSKLRIMIAVIVTFIMTLVLSGVLGYIYVSNYLGNMGLTNVEAKKAQDKKVGKVGETKAIGNVTYKLVSAEEVGSRNEYSDEEIPKHVVKLTYKLENNGETEAMITEPELYNEKGTKLKEYHMVDGSRSVFKIKPGKNDTGTVYFETEGKGAYEFQLSELVVGNSDSAKFNIHLKGDVGIDKDVENKKTEDRLDEKEQDIFDEKEQDILDDKQKAELEDWLKELEKEQNDYLDSI